MSTTCSSQEHQEVQSHSGAATKIFQPQTLHGSCTTTTTWLLGRAHLPTSNGDIAVSLELSNYNSVLKNVDLDDDSNPTSTPSLRRLPVQQDSHLDADRHQIYRKVVGVADRHQIYRKVVGVLIWAAQVRPDLQFTAKDHLTSGLALAAHQAHTQVHQGDHAVQVPRLTSTTSRSLTTSVTADASSHQHLF